MVAAVHSVQQYRPIDVYAKEVIRIGITLQLITYGLSNGHAVRQYVRSAILATAWLLMINLALLPFIQINIVQRRSFSFASYRGYCGGSPTAVQAQRTCPLWELSPSHPILLYTRGLAVFICVTVICILLCVCVCVCVCIFCFLYFLCCFPLQLSPSVL